MGGRVVGWVLLFEERLGGGVEPDPMPYVLARVLSLSQVPRTTTMCGHWHIPTQTRSSSALISAAPRLWTAS